MASGQDVSSSVRSIRSILSGVLIDESFEVPTSENKKCIAIAQRLITVFGTSDSAVQKKCKEFSSWLVRVFQDIIDKAKKRNGLLNAEHLWSRFHNLTVSQSLKEHWEEFLDSCDVDKEPVFYQHINDEVFDKLITQTVGTSSSSSCADVDVIEECQDQTLTYEEENAIYYVGGYVVNSLMKQKNSSNLNILEEFINKDEMDLENVADEWLKAIDRGGLTRITTEAFQLFYSIETCTRRHLTLKKTLQMDDSFRKHLSNCVLNDQNVLFYWCMAGQDESDEDAQKCLEKNRSKMDNHQGALICKQYNGNVQAEA